jgi:hypothetical protein
LQSKCGKVQRRSKNLELQWSKLVGKRNKDGLDDARPALTRILALDDVAASNDADASDCVRQPRRCDSASGCTSEWKEWREPYEATPAAAHARSQLISMSYAIRRRQARHVLKACCWREPYQQTRAAPDDRAQQVYSGFDLRRRRARHVEKSCAIVRSAGDWLRKTLRRG